MTHWSSGNKSYIAQRYLKVKQLLLFVYMNVIKSTPFTKNKNEKENSNIKVYISFISILFIVQKISLIIDLFKLHVLF